MASVSLVLSEHYANRRPPKTLLVRAPITDSMNHWLSERRGKKVSVRNPQRGELAKLRSMADANAEIQAADAVNQEVWNLKKRLQTKPQKYTDSNHLTTLYASIWLKFRAKKESGPL